MKLVTVYLDAKKIEIEIAAFLENKLKDNEKVVWLLSGGSNIPIEANIMKLIDDSLTSKLIIGLIDERFGPINHTNSNYKQLIDASFNSKKAKFIKVLSNNSANITKTSQEYETIVNDIFNKNIYTVGILGIGLDGHLAGILPNSTIIESNKLVDFYETADFNRITLTYAGLKKLNQIFVITIGDEKDNIIKKISSDNENNLKELPANILKELSSVKIYNIK